MIKWERITNNAYTDAVTTLPESGDLYDNITEVGVAEGDPPPPQME